MKLSTQLKKQAQELRINSPEVVAVDMLKKAGVSDTVARIEVAQKLMEKEAADHLVASGIDYDSAMAMVKVADLKISDLTEFKPEKSVEEILSDQLLKTASAVEELEAKADQVDMLLEKIARLEVQLDNQVEVTPVESAPMAKFASSGAFTNADLEALNKLSTSTLTKLASIQDEPWRMGKTAGKADAGMDPIEQFCMS